MPLKTVEELLVEALDKVATKSVAAAKKINESTITVEEKLAAATELLEGATKKHAWMTAESALSKLVVEIRESFNEFRPAVTKHNGALDNTPFRESANADDNKNEKIFEAARRMGMTEVEARLFADPDYDPQIDRVRDAILKA